MGKPQTGSMRLLARQAMLSAVWLAVALPSFVGIAADLIRDPDLRVSLASLCRAYTDPAPADPAQDGDLSRPQCVFCLSGAAPAVFLAASSPVLPLPPEPVRLGPWEAADPLAPGLQPSRLRNRGPPATVT